MSTFSQDTNAKAAQSKTPKDDATQEDIKQADETVTTDQEQVPQDNPHQPTETLDETASETADRHVASTELPVGDVTDPASQARETDEDGELDPEGDFKTADAEAAAEKVVPGAAAGPEVDGTVRNDAGRPAYAPPGSMNAAMNGVQEDAAGHVDSVNTDNSTKSGTRV
jgi:hypothetical protein